ncbi:SDR family oxidoreductase [Rhizobium wenxiniae]|uniref:SDR family NAD(P)-dependent oxidoreductase n=1 Tax=Rhizobium wenxiniae TaxID=1737357 RepID=UPI001C6EAC34|nr:SDR family oxidoreductase [Rhizobium wenxiniae]MBW9089489.1 SDR family oxidoreductase [Rhizobium wenxiniae]
MTIGTALVTGASSGIGTVYAEKLAQRGYDLKLIARDRDRLDRLAEKLSADHGVTVQALPADLSEPADLEYVSSMLSYDASLRLLVNCAGIGPSGKVLASETAGLAGMVYLNVDALHLLTVAAAKAFVARGQGGIINIASVVALMPERFNPSYVASKAFVLALTQAMAVELEPHGVRIQAVLPGFTRTEIFGRAGIDINIIPDEMMMDAEEMVSAALAGFDQGEIVTIPSLADARLWETLEDARHSLAPHLSLKHAAERYGVTKARRLAR